MFSDLYRVITNSLYFVSSQVQRYRDRNNNIVVLAAGATKARKLDKDDDVKSGAGWISSRRAVLMLTNKNLICGSWEIPLASVKEARLLRVKSLGAKALILKISAEDGYYQFGLQYDPAWEQQTALELIIEDGKIKRSFVKRLFRILIWLYLIGMCVISLWIMYKDLLGRN